MGLSRKCLLTHLEQCQPEPGLRMFLISVYVIAPMGLEIEHLVLKTSGWQYFEGFIVEELNINSYSEFLTNESDFTNTLSN